MFVFRKTRSIIVGFIAVMLPLFVSLPAVGQINVGIKCDNIKYIEGERIVAKVVVQNETEAPLVFNKVYNNAELQICVTSGSHIDCIPAVKNLNRDFVIMPGDTANEFIALGSLVDLHRSGAYQVNGRILYNGKMFTSKSFGFDVVKGIELASRKRVLRDYPNVVLAYSLRYLGRESREYAFMVICDVDNGDVYGAFNLGPILRVFPPSLKFDDNSDIVIVHQSGQKRYTRTIITVNREGAKVIKQSHHRPDGKNIKR